MTSWTDLHARRQLLSQKWYGAPGVQVITAPAGAAYIRASAVGAGGWDTGHTGAPGVDGGSPGWGAAFARVKAACTPGEQFSLQVGDVLHTMGAGTTAGDTTLTRVTGGAVILKAERGKATAAGLAANSIGDTKRSGSAPSGAGTAAIGGASGGDDADTFPLGFGGRGGQRFLSAARGGGGINDMLVYHAFPGGLDYVLYLKILPGNGLMCVQFFNQNPGVAWPGY